MYIMCSIYVSSVFSEKCENVYLQMNCHMKLAQNGGTKDIEFSVEIFESREWHNKYKESEEISPDEIVESNEHQIFIARIKRISVEFEAVPGIFLQFTV